MIEIEVDLTSFIPPEEPDDEEAPKLNEVEKHRENIRTIFLATNATPIGRYASLGYTCCYCPQVYPDPRDLKKHTIEQHDEENINSFMTNHTMLNYIVKLDITDLRCEMCMRPFDELQDIMNHLSKDHKKYFHNDIPSHIVPFRFNSDTLDCVDCQLKFRNFKILLEHMNSHYSNHICEVCEAGFVNRRMLQAHMSRHKTGVFKCGFCSKVFDTRVKMKVHERMVHMCVKKRPKCSICEKKFKVFEKMIEHEELKHGLHREFKCEVCLRMFSEKRAFQTHQKLYCTGDT